MKTKILILFIGLMTIAFLCHAGERRMIKQFDKAGLKELNNQLKKQEKLIQKLTKQLQAGGTITSGKPVQTQEDFVSETVLEGAGSNITSVPAVGIAREDGRLELYSNEDENDIIHIEPTSYVHETQAKIAVPSSYFLDLRASANDDYWAISADVLVLRDANGNTVTLNSVSETNYRLTVGNGGRDQVSDWANAWVHLYVIYNPTSQDVTTRVSSSASAPTLPSGYTFYVRVSSARVNGTPKYVDIRQMNDVVTYNVQWPKWDSHVATPATFEELSIADYVPATAKMVHGVMGLSAGTTARKMRVACDAGVVYVGALCDAQGTGDKSFGVSGSKDFSLPLPTAQTIWWDTETTGDIYAIGLVGFTDDL